MASAALNKKTRENIIIIFVAINVRVVIIKDDARIIDEKRTGRGGGVKPICR